LIQGKQDVRQVRKEAIDHVKKLKGSVSDDHLKRYTKDIETVMEKKIEKIVKILKDKEVELMK
jgi:ribosome recycling factor